MHDLKNFDNLPREERLAILKKASDALREGNLIECQKITRAIPIDPETAKIFTLLYGDDYLEKNGYNTSELKNYA